MSRNALLTWFPLDAPAANVMRPDQRSMSPPSSPSASELLGLEVSHEFLGVPFGKDVPAFTRVIE
jgi:hypothetical protein